MGQVFKLGASQLVQMAETGTAESGQKTVYDQDGFTGIQVRFPGFELYLLKADKGARTVSIPNLHDNTAEVCLVISGRVRLTVLGEPRELGPGNALRFKALQEHELETLADTELLLIHHHLS